MKRHTIAMFIYLAATVGAIALIELDPEGFNAWHIAMVFCGFVAGMVFDQAIVVGVRNMIKGVTKP